MTSDETTICDYYIETTHNIAKICTKVEAYYRYNNKYTKRNSSNITSAVADSVVTASNEMDTKLVAVATM